MESLQDLSKKEKITLFGWSHTTLPESRSFFSEMGCQESHEERNFPEKPRESDSILSGWICFWYPKELLRSEE